MIEIGSAINEYGDAVDVKPERQRIGVTVRGNSAKAERAMIESDNDV